MKKTTPRKLKIPEPTEWSKEMRRSLRTWQTQIDLNGRVQMNVNGLTIYFYSAELASILIANEFDAINLDTNRKVKIKGSEWLQSFVDGYKKGVEDFKSNHKASPDTLHGAGSSVYIENLIYQYKEAPNKLGAGWEIVKSKRLYALNHPFLNNFGYYSALTSEYLEIKNNNPKLFASPSILETKTQRLKSVLAEVGFFDLPMVQALSESNKQKLVEIISSKKLPFAIAMFEHLKFIKHLEKEYFKNKPLLYEAIAEWFDVGMRTVKGNILVLMRTSKEDRVRYTADQQKEIAQIEYEKLK
jgi:hypothetical protein